MTQLTRRRVALLAIPVMLVCGLIVLMVSGLLVAGIGPLHLNTSPAAVTTGPGHVTITTDHARYLSTDTIAVTVTNSRPGPIYMWDGNAYCSPGRHEALAILDRRGDCRGAGDRTVGCLGLGQPSFAIPESNGGKRACERRRQRLLDGLAVSGVRQNVVRVRPDA